MDMGINDSYRNQKTIILVLNINQCVSGIILQTHMQ